MIVQEVGEGLAPHQERRMVALKTARRLGQARQIRSADQPSIFSRRFRHFPFPVLFLM